MAGVPGCSPWWREKRRFVESRNTGRHLGPSILLLFGGEHGEIES